MSAEDDDDVDRDAKTPKHGLTGTWELHAGIALGLAGQLDALERDFRHSHPERADSYRGLRLAMKSFGDRFERWKLDPTISFHEKSGDLEDFGSVREAVLKVIARASSSGRTTDRTTEPSRR